MNRPAPLPGRVLLEIRGEIASRVIADRDLAYALDQAALRDRLRPNWYSLRDGSAVYVLEIRESDAAALVRRLEEIARVLPGGG